MNEWLFCCKSAELIMERFTAFGTLALEYMV